MNEKDMCDTLDRMRTEATRLVTLTGEAIRVLEEKIKWLKKQRRKLLNGYADIYSEKRNKSGFDCDSTGDIFDIGSNCGDTQQEGK